MIGHVLLYGIACNCLFVSGTILSPLTKVDPASTFDLYENGEPSVPNEYDYAIVKRGARDARDARDPRDPQESADSKERRSQMGSSFIRFGRNRFEGNLENADYSSMSGDAAGDELDSRTARGRSDVIIRFGRSELKNIRGTNFHSRRLTGADLVKLLEHGNERRTKLYGRRSLDRGDGLDRVTFVCSNVLASTNELNSNVVASGIYVDGKLYRPCDSLGLGIDEKDENNRRVIGSKISEILEDVASRAEFIKRE